MGGRFGVIVGIVAVASGVLGAVVGSVAITGVSVAVLGATGLNEIGQKRKVKEGAEGLGGSGRAAGGSGRAAGGSGRLDRPGIDADILHGDDIDDSPTGFGKLGNRDGWRGIDEGGWSA